MRNKAFNTKGVQYADLPTLDARVENVQKLIQQRIFSAKVTKAHSIDLSGLGLTIVPSEILACKELRRIDLSQNKLTELSARFAKLPHLTHLDISSNSIVDKNLNIESLSNLTFLDISFNPIQELGTKFSRLKNLKTLVARACSINVLTDEFCSLKSLRHLDLTQNNIESIPDSLSNMTNLELLGMASNSIKSIPTSIGLLVNLASLDLHSNQISRMPPDVGKLLLLKSLILSENPLEGLPPELGRIRKLMDLALPEDQRFIPPDVCVQGPTAILAYLRSFLDENALIYPRQAKLVLVGQGNSGKTFLVNNLLSEDSESYQGKTEGVEVRKLHVKHSANGENMVLSVWDFGGQEIQHATHQFFLTNRSIFLLVWNARQDVGKRGGNLQYWLEMIQSRAPESPVILIATHCDQEPARVSIDYWKDQFPNICGIVEVGNKTKKGIDEVLSSIQQTASQLDVIDEAWNRRWLDARNAIKEINKPYIQPSEAWRIMAEHGVEPDEMTIIAARMHLLGDIVYFRENPELKDTIVLDPEWLTKRVCQAVSSDLVQKNLGVMTSEILESTWSDESAHVREELLRFMEQYDLSYRVESGKHDSIVVQALPDSPTTDLWETWNYFQEYPTLHLKYRFKGTLPPGIPSWFIAREHRFTRNLHWRYGAVLQDRNGDHRALIHLVETAGDLHVYLGVRGPEPVRFFSILQDGFEETISRYPGLEVKRVVPCSGMGCASDSQCDHEYRLEELEKYRERGREMIICGSSLDEHQVVRLLYGIAIPKAPASFERYVRNLSLEVVDKIDDLREDTLQLVGEVLGYQQREFTKIFTMFQSHEETQSPSVFVLEKPKEGWTRKALGQKLTVKLCCEMPGCWHPLPEGEGEYSVSDPARWLVRVAPLFRRLVKALKVGMPLTSAVIGYSWSEIEEMFKNNLELACELTNILPDIQDVDDSQPDKLEAGRATGASLGALREVLSKGDPYLSRTGLQKVLMPEKNYLWLCRQHADEILNESRQSRRDSEELSV